jgi:hypothetical protein
MGMSQKRHKSDAWVLQVYFRGVIEMLPFKPADFEVEKSVDRKHAKLTRDSENAKNLK